MIWSKLGVSTIRTSNLVSKITSTNAWHAEHAEGYNKKAYLGKVEIGKNQRCNFVY